MKYSLIFIFGLFIILFATSFFLINKSRNKASQSNVETNQNKEQQKLQKTEIYSENYLEYSKEAFEQNKGKKKVLFFSAVWCPTCTVANTDIRDQINDIPDDLVILKVDYDTATDLKEKYGITYQHTFVYVDDNGTEINKWNGGALKEILEHIN